MKKLIWITCGIILMSGSCDSDCNDCGPTGYTRYYMKNSTDEDARLYWFGNTYLPSNITHEFTVSAGGRVLLYESSSTGTSGLISTPPFNSITPYDSAKFELTSTNTFAYLKDDCELSGNPLCEENYELINSIDTEKQKIKEWEFTIK